MFLHLDIHPNYHKARCYYALYSAIVTPTDTIYTSSITPVAMENTDDLVINVIPAETEETMNQHLILSVECDRTQWKIHDVHTVFAEKASLKCFHQSLRISNFWSKQNFLPTDCGLTEWLTAELVYISPMLPRHHNGTGCIVSIRGVCRNFEKRFPLHQNDR